jgi:nucleoid-associated protein YgaU
MTRETKVGLLVGMAIILLIGIIVSDLLVEPAATAPPALQRMAGGVERELATSEPAATTYEASPSRWAHPSSSSSLPSPQRERSRPVPTPAELQPNTPPGFESGSRLTTPIAAGRIAAPAQAQTQAQVVTFDRPASNPEALADALPQLPASRQPIATTDAAAAPTASSTAASIASAARPTSVGTVTVGSGDTLYRIAERTLGDGNRWRELYEANRDTLTSPDVLRAGMSLRIPGRSAPSASNSGGATTRPESGRTTVYTVQSGDTLYRIAARSLGDGNRWRELYEANRSVIGSDPARLEAGMKLALPR